MSKPDPKKNKQSKKLRKGPLIALIILIVLLLAFAGAFWWYSSSLAPVRSSGEKITVEISEGESTEELLNDLKEKGLIRSDTASRIYLKLHQGFSHYPGRFELSPDQSAKDIFAWLSNPDNALPSYAVVTIPEGTWARDIAQIISDALPDISKEELLTLWNDSNYIDTLAQSYSFLDPAALKNDAYFVKLEGYLYPETYYMDFDMDADGVTRMMLDQFSKVYEQIRPDVEASSRSLQEILTMASIIQFESGSAADMPDIAGVFYNRLEQGMPLQSSVTVCYALYDDFNTHEDCETRTDIDSPYNTYLHDGLPIGPILNPGFDAIQAALHPADNDYLFFVADIYGDGSVHYASTFEEHQANIEKYNLTISE